MIRRGFLCAAALPLAGALVSLSLRSAWAQNDWSSVEAAAKREGRLVLYHNFAAASMERIVAAFNEDYPQIRVSEVRLASAAFYQRFGAEYAGGRSEADVCSAAWDDLLETWAAQGWMEEWTPPEAAALPEQMRFGQRFWAIQVAREMIVYNSAKVKAADAPKDWLDLFDPKWKGRIGMNPPWRSVGPQLAAAFVEARFGVKDMAERLQQLDVRFFNGSAGVLQAVVRGDVSVAQMTDLPLNAALADGVPVKAVYPTSGVPYTPILTFVPAKVKNPNAGRVMANWLMSVRGQRAIQELSGAPGTRKGLGPPKFVPANAQIQLVDNRSLLNEQTQKRVVDQWRRVFNVQ